MGRLPAIGGTWAPPKKRKPRGEQRPERVAFTIPEFCFRNSLSRPTYHRLRSQGRGPVEMRIGLNMIRITAEAERDWQRLMQEPNEALEQQAVARAVKAGDAAVKSDKHVSKRTRRGGAVESKQQHNRSNTP